MINLALLGAGRIGQAHGRAVAGHRGAHLKWVYDPIAAAAETFAAAHGAGVAGLDQILTDPEIKGVLVCTPTDTHADLICRVVSAGKAVFCEKPIAISVDETERVLDHVNAHDGLLMLGFQRRFDANFRALKQRLVSGQSGALESLLVISRDPAPPPTSYMKSSGGLFKDMMIHDFDMALWLLDEPVTSVYAVGGALTDPKVASEGGDIDTASVIMTTASGKQCTILNNRRATYGYDQRVEALCAGGMLQVNSVRENTLVISDQQGLAERPLQDFFMQRYEAAYAAEIVHFVDSLLAGTTPEVNGQDGLAALRLAQAAGQSLASGVPVRLD